MTPRRLKTALDRGLEQHAGIVMLGPRQVGKTTLALEVAESRASLYLDLERPSDMAKLADLMRDLLALSR